MFNFGTDGFMLGLETSCSGLRRVLLMNTDVRGGGAQEPVQEAQGGGHRALCLPPQAGCPLASLHMHRCCVPSSVMRLSQHHLCGML
jgi:hypothetical protein